MIGLAGHCWASLATFDSSTTPATSDAKVHSERTTAGIEFLFR
jgi:hypothetical protein